MNSQHYPKTKPASEINTSSARVVVHGCTVEPKDMVEIHQEVPDPLDYIPSQAKLAGVGA